ncbi:MAG: pimeloyl-ACP methyl ester carboxylesterase, partial [Planctomycetota bacterium]
RGLISGLRSHYRVVAPDHMGCGLSDKPQDYAYTLEQHSLNVERLVLELDLKNITLVLHDWGGAIGMGFARRHPDRIKRIVVMNTAAFCSTKIPFRIAVCRWPIFGPLAVRGFGAFSHAALSMAIERKQNMTDAVRRGYLAPYGGWHNRVATMAFVRDIPLNKSHPTYAELRATDDALENFKDTPMCIIWGDRDWCFTTEFRKEWERRFENARVHAVEDAGHWILEDEGPNALRWIAQFLKDTPGSNE